mmetsp:Transcript_29294/g.57513  ORF Transcript_29294/g.57513 Transcript_29294/m.57513 type:complete len:318 (+) Transcript_29294:124-1077(+)
MVEATERLIPVARRYLVHQVTAGVCGLDLIGLTHCQPGIHVRNLINRKGKRSMKNAPPPPISALLAKLKGPLYLPLFFWGREKRLLHRLNARMKNSKPINLFTHSFATFPVHRNECSNERKIEGRTDRRTDGRPPLKPSDMRRGTSKESQDRETERQTGRQIRIHTLPRFRVVRRLVLPFPSYFPPPAKVKQTPPLANPRMIANSFLSTLRRGMQGTGQAEERSRTPRGPWPGAGAAAAPRERRPLRRHPLRTRTSSCWAPLSWRRRRECLCRGPRVQSRSSGSTGRASAERRSSAGLSAPRLPGRAARRLLSVRLV